MVCERMYGFGLCFNRRTSNFFSQLYQILLLDPATNDAACLWPFAGVAQCLGHDFGRVLHSGICVPGAAIFDNERLFLDNMQVSA